MKVDKTKQKICRLEDICVVRTGRKDANHASDNGEYPFFTCGTNPLKSTTYSFDGENLIIPGNGDIGRCFYYNGKIEAYQRTYVLHLKENSNIDIKYLYLVFKAGWKLFVKNKILGAAMPYIKLGHLNSFPITIYELGVQKAIATELDSIQTMIDGYKAQLADLDALAQSIFLDMFGDPITNPKGWKLSNILSFVDEITSSKRIFANEYVKEGIPFYRIKEIIEKANQRPISVELFITEDRYSEIKASFGVPQINDLLITAVGSIGEIWIVDNDMPFYFKDGNVIWLKTSKDAVPIYLKEELFHIIANTKDKMNGAAYSALTIVKLKAINIPNPPLCFQQQFAKQVKAIEQQKELIRQQLADAETLMAERMQYYFS